MTNTLSMLRAWRFTRSGPSAIVGAPVPIRRRLLLSVLLGMITGAVTLQRILNSPLPRDFGQVWFAARSILAGLNPYALVGPHLAYDWPWPLLYPLPAAIIAIPLSPFPLPIATVLFSTLAGMAFAWALMEYGYGPLFGFFSGSVHMAAEAAQWSPLLAAAVVVPPLSIFLIAKPTIGAAIFFARPSRWAIGGGVVLAAIAFAVQPTWLMDWLGAIAQNNRQWAPNRPYQAPLLYPGGILALAALARWRRPEARLIAALACVPQTTMQYEAVPLFLVPRTFVESAILVACSYAQHFFGRYLVSSMPTPEEHLQLSGRWLALVMYIPVTIMVLRRPNEAPPSEK
ncbi:MAG: hypothetical protein JWL95_2888 [Gemmatimonadetes bacterium]|nr:hypothetical protein [Gemmatimonadota bacterium]